MCYEVVVYLLSRCTSILYVIILTRDEIKTDSLTLRGELVSLDERIREVYGG